MSELEGLKQQATYRGWSIARLGWWLYAWKGKNGENGVIKAATTKGLFRKIRERETRGGMRQNELRRMDR